MLTVMAAVAFLTRIPVRGAATPAEVRRAAQFFPAVGALVGGIQALLVLIVGTALPPLPLAALVVTLGVAVTGGLHVDGLADTADGLGVARSREEALRIMRDPAVGAYGTTAIALVLMLKTAAITALIDRHSAAAALVGAAAGGRWSMAALGRMLPYARPSGGLGLDAGRSTTWQLATATGFSAGILAALGAPLHAPAVALLVTTGVGLVALRRLGGFTGDVLGASSELVEVAILFAWLAA